MKMTQAQKEFMKCILKRVEKLISQIPGGGGVPEGINYKELMFTLTQTGTDAPVQTTLTDTTDGITITWVRLGVGQYEGTASVGALTYSNCVIFDITRNIGVTGNIVITGGKLRINTNGGPPADGILNDTPYYIRFY